MAKNNNSFSKAAENVEKNQAKAKTSIDKYMPSFPDLNIGFTNKSVGTTTEDKEEPIAANLQPVVELPTTGAIEVPETPIEGDTALKEVDEKDILAYITKENKKGKREQFTSSLKSESKIALDKICTALDISQVDFFENAISYFDENLSKEIKKRIRKKYNL